MAQHQTAPSHVSGEEKPAPIHERIDLGQHIIVPNPICRFSYKKVHETTLKTPGELNKSDNLWESRHYAEVFAFDFAERAGPNNPKVWAEVRKLAGLDAYI